MIKWLLYKLGQSIALFFPRKAGYWLAIFLCRMQFYLSVKDRRAVIYNMKRVMPEACPGKIWAASREVFENFGKYLIDFFRFPSIDDDFMARYITVTNIENLDKGLKISPGVIALSAHFGNWELGGAVVGKLGYPFSEVALAHKDARVNRFFNQQRKSCGAEVIPLGIALKKCYQLLKNKNVIAFLGDRDFGGRGVEARFCGKKVVVPRGPAKFCLKTKAAIVPSFMVRRPDDSFELIFEEPLFAYTPEGRLKTEGELIEDYLLTIERYVKAYPSQWYMFQPFFKE